jgi:hypothetical protein
MSGSTSGQSVASRRNGVNLGEVMVGQKPTQMLSVGSMEAVPVSTAGGDAQGTYVGDDAFLSQGRMLMF